MTLAGHLGRAPQQWRALSRAFWGLPGSLTTLSWVVPFPSKPLYCQPRTHTWLSQPELPPWPQCQMDHSTGAGEVHLASSLSICPLLTAQHAATRATWGLTPTGSMCSSCLLCPQPFHIALALAIVNCSRSPGTFYPFSSLCLCFPESSTRPPILQPPLSAQLSKCYLPSSSNVLFLGSCGTLSSKLLWHCLHV